MSSRHTVLLIPSNSSYLPPSLSRRQPAPLTPLDATLMHFPASVANKRLTAELTPLTATLTKNEGGPFPRTPHFAKGKRNQTFARSIAPGPSAISYPQSLFHASLHPYLITSILFP